MKIKSIKVYHCKAGWRIWSFLKIQTTDDLYGWSECSESNGSTKAIQAAIEDMADLLINKDPFQIQRITNELFARTIQSSGGVIHKAIAAIENALLDIKAKYLDQPVHSMLGGAVRKKIPLYWSHCGTSRVRAFDIIKKPRIKTFKDLEEFCVEINNSGFKTIKTNIGILGEEEPIVYMPGNSKTYGWPDLELTNLRLFYYFLL